MGIHSDSLQQTVTCIVVTFVVVVCLGVWSAAAREPAQAVVERFDSLLLTTMKKGQQLSFEARYDKLAERVDQDFDIRRIAQRRLGDRWAQMNGDERQAYTARVRKTLIARYAHTYDHYAGQRFDICGLRPLGDDTRQVEVALIDPDGMRRVTRYTVARDEGEWRVVGVSPGMGFSGPETAALVPRDTPKALFGGLERRLAGGPRV
ncbi:ABC transporter substrate-binding protein [Salinisphaera sp.]|uniref:ABC transporter substrate-binding protein n=1 Tax=Salinisphaera sp. TaxID=1914330 RepID=UPI000C6C22A9|nr:ABC transporter substrate-binding protein [Salinisphaera sp.]MBS61709.1 hypothetical protein [Salinisphaera sp.]